MAASGHRISNVALCLFFGEDLTLAQVRDGSGWKFPGGGVKRGEKLFRALQREYEEEMYASLPTLEFLEYYDYPSHRPHTRIYYAYTRKRVPLRAERDIGFYRRKGEREIIETDNPSYYTACSDPAKRYPSYVLHSWKALHSDPAFLYFLLGLNLDPVQGKRVIARGGGLSGFFQTCKTFLGF